MDLNAQLSAFRKREKLRRNGDWFHHQPPIKSAYRRTQIAFKTFKTFPFARGKIGFYDRPLNKLSLHLPPRIIHRLSLNNQFPGQQQEAR